MSAENKTQGPLAALPKKQPTVVGIGASAGGLAALKTFFHHVPADSGLAFVVVVHLSPDHKSHLADLLQPHVSIPVRQIAEHTPLDPNQVYVIPPNANLNAIDTHLRLSKLEENRRERAPIDHFFRTLATTFDGSSIGVILTGTGSDGTLGIKDIKGHGGLVLVQNPNEAEFDGMPQSAIASGLVDKVLNLQEIVETILRYDRTAPRILASANEEQTDQAEQQHLQRIFAILRARTDRDFSRYKPSTILRRIARRMQLNYIEELPKYIERLRDHPDEARALADDFLITVTSFFRDSEVFEKLRTEVIPRIFEGKDQADAVRVWSVGCATGEEAYSIVMLMLEEAARRDTAPKLQVFASDLHRRSLQKAREGFYPGDIEGDVTSERLQRFFQKENGGYRIRKEVRDLVVFAPHNLLGDPPFSRLDLITCRNLLIYLQRNVQQEVIELFHYALLPEGELVLGTAETVDGSHLFRATDKKLCFYRKRNVPGPEPRLPVFPLIRNRTGAIPLPPDGDRLRDPDAYGLIHHRFLERFAPPSVLVGLDNQLVHLSESAGRYLVHPGGELTASIFKLVREELRVELQAAVQSARQHRAAYDSKPVPVRFNGHARPVVMRVRLSPGVDHEGFVLVMFDEYERSIPNEIAEPSPPHGPREESEGVERLEAELRLAHRRLQTSIEEYESSQEEMKAANEEMQSTNEELRSTMEELETSKEELQSINEELQTVNQENRHKVEELAQLTGDLQNLLIATDIATLFLDRSLRIHRFTPKLGDLFNVRQTDRGRPISDLTHRLGYSHLRSDAESVLANLAAIEREVEDERGRWYLVRILPYRSTEDRIEGVVITFTDISRSRQGEAALEESQERLVSALAAGRMATFDWNPQTESMTFLRGASDILGTDPNATYPSVEAVTNLVHPEDRESRRAALQVSAGGAEDFQVEYRVVRPVDGRVVWIAERGRATRDAKTGAVRVRGLIWDITARRESEDRLRMLVGELNHRVKNTLATVQSMASQTRRHTETPEDFSTHFQGRLHALARAHDLVTGSNWEGAEVSEIVSQQIGFDGAPERISLHGPLARLDPQTSLALALVLHELGTNARKYGSLSVPDGRLEITWATRRKRGETRLGIEWVERGGPPVTPPGKAGFGTEMIRRGLAGVGGEADLRFEAAGLSCHIVLAPQGDRPGAGDGW
jgi:two-component system CheB/CheR fusion protein